MHFFRSTLCISMVCLSVLNVHAQNKARAAAPAPTITDSTCIVADLKAIALENHDVNERGLQAKAWLQKYGPNCSPFQIAVISANRNSWLGHADSPNFVAMIDRINEMKNINMTYFPSASNAAGDDPASSQVGAGASSRPRPATPVNQIPGMVQPIVQPNMQPNAQPNAQPNVQANTQPRVAPAQPLQAPAPQAPAAARQPQSGAAVNPGQAALAPAPASR